MENSDIKIIHSPHTNLCHDLAELSKEALDFEFHDFKNTTYASPKVELVMKLESLIKKVKDGDYDN